MRIGRHWLAYGLFGILALLAALAASPFVPLPGLIDEAGQHLSRFSGSGFLWLALIFLGLGRALQNARRLDRTNRAIAAALFDGYRTNFLQPLTDYLRSRPEGGDFRLLIVEPSLTLLDNKAMIDELTGKLARHGFRIDTQEGKAVGVRNLFAVMKARPEPGSGDPTVIVDVPTTLRVLKSIAEFDLARRGGGPIDPARLARAFAERRREFFDELALWITASGLSAHVRHVHGEAGHAEDVAKAIAAELTAQG